MNKPKSKEVIRTIFVVGGDVGYANWMEGVLVDSVEKAHLIVFSGGEDVDPMFYNSPKHPSTYSYVARDVREKAVYEQALRLKKPMVGICRGSQFLCVMNGGKLVQHQRDDAFYHWLNTYDNKKVITSSMHHQAQYPWNLPENSYKILAWTKGFSDFHEDGNKKELPKTAEKECEIVFYPKSRCLAIQGHPETMISRKDMEKDVQYFKELLNNFLEEKL